VLSSIDRVEIMPFVKMHRQVTTANALKDTERDPMLKSLANNRTLMFYATAISIAQITRNVLKVNASVRKDLRHKERFVSTSMSAEIREIFAVNELHAVIFPEAINVNAMPDLLARLRDYHVKNLALTFNVGLTPIAKSKRTKRFAFVRKVGHSYPLIFLKGAWTLMSAIALMDHLVCVA
jgi:hypothetical protein